MRRAWIHTNEWGGEYEFIPISAKTGKGVENLLETILIQAEVLELKATQQGQAKAIVLEASLEKGRGPVATIIVQMVCLSWGFGCCGYCFWASEGIT